MDFNGKQAIEELRAEILAVKTRVALLLPVGFTSLIVAAFPALFAEFRGKRFMLLWRGSCHGFGARAFHGRCDGHAPTLTLIQDTEGNIFSGFTPVKWESLTGTHGECCKADPSLKSFLFTLKNPHNFPERKFALKAEKKDEAIKCYSELGPCFGGIWVSNNCNASIPQACNSDGWCFSIPSGSNLGHVYANDTGLDGDTVLTGSRDFTVKEVEVFEIAD